MSEQRTNTVFELVLDGSAQQLLLSWLAKKVLLAEAGRFGYAPKRPASARDTLHLTVSESISSLPVWIREQGHSYQTLRAYNPWLVGQSLHLSAQESYVLSLPKR